MICPNCKKQVERGMKFCPGCGHKMPSEEEIRCPHCGNPVRPEARFCQRCGQKLPSSAGVSFCRQCGSPCPPGTTICDACQRKGRLAVLLRILCALLIVAIGALLWLWIADPFHWQGEEPSDTEAYLISLDADELSLAPGETASLTATIETDAQQWSGSLRWESSDPSVAAVEETGPTTAVISWTGEGTCSVSVSVQGGAETDETVASDTCLVRCDASETVLPQSVTLSEESLLLEEGGGMTLTASLDVPADAWDGTLVWTSSDESVAVVESTGALTAEVRWMGEGTCTVTAAVPGADGAAASCEVECAAPAPEIDFPVGTVEYDGHHYLVCMEETDWESAQAACEAMGGHLATITSEEENEFVYQLACTYSTELAFLLGGTDRDHEGTFVWVTGEPFTYTNWGYLNQPDNYREYKDQDYMTILTFDQSGKYYDDSGESWGTHASEWDDKDGQSNPYICEWDF